MIKREDFQEQFKYYDREVVREIIDLFLASYQQQLDQLNQSIALLDLEMVNMHAHSLKGLAGTFVCHDTHRLASELEKKAGQKEREGLAELFLLLDASTREMAGDLQQIRDVDYS